MEFLQNGEGIGEIEGFRVTPGQQGYTVARSLGGRSERIPTLREPDTVTFTLKGMGFDIDAKHAIRYPDGRTRPLLVTDVRYGPGTCAIHAILQ